jgi:uncharacterized protein (TIGR00251 family)
MINYQLCPPMTILRVKVKPNSKQQLIREEPDGGFTVYLKSPPADGKANRELIEVLAKQFGVPKSRVSIKSGASSRNKLVELPE